MFRKTRAIVATSVLITCLAVACGGSPPEMGVGTVPDGVRVNTTVLWNERAVALVVARPPAANGQAAVSRILTYLSLAQYRAVTAAHTARGEARPPSISAAVGGASVAVLNGWFPLDVASTEALLDGDLATAHRRVAVDPPPGYVDHHDRAVLLQSANESKEDLAAGESLGRDIGAAVLAQAAQDNYLAVSLDAPPVGPGMWTSSAAPTVRSLHGARPFFLTAADQLRAPAPPAFGSPQFAAALAEVRQISDGRTAEQTALAQSWNTSSGPFTAGSLNLVAGGLIRDNGSTEQEAARILAFANAAMFDAQIACWDTKIAYWVLRPSQADPAITLPIGLPNHPSYPSGHSCLTAAMMATLSQAFPKERARLEAMVEEAGLSRLYGGIHYRFDLEAGREIGRAAAALARTGNLD
jgi:membrane-associated phospholipid phosphatase